MASNPAALRLPALSREHKLAYLSRATLQRRYATELTPMCGKGATGHADRQ